MKKQSGQSLVVGLMFLPIVVLFLLYLYNVSQQNLHKTRLQNTADAAVVSGSQFLARELNFKAYTNRAMIANHVAIGQYVGLSSWFNFAVETFDNIEDVAKYIPYIGSYFTSAEQYLDNINESILQPGLELAVTFTDLVNTILSNSQTVMALSSAAAMVDSFDDVIKLNDPQASLDAISTATLSINVYKWMEYQSGFDRTDDTGRYGEYFQVVTDSRDSFLTDRSHDWPSAVPNVCLPLFFRISQTGGTDLINHGEDAKETWTSMDTLSLNLKKPKLFGGCKNIEVPIGWGGAHAGEDNDTDEYQSTEIYGKSRDINEHASEYADERESAMNDAYSGIQQFYSIKELSTSNDAPPVTIVVSKLLNALQTSKNLNIGTVNEDNTRNVDINIEEYVEVPRQKFSSVAKSRIYYHRATDLWPNDRFEYANLYNPYWQISLQDIDNTERGLLLGSVFGLNSVGY